MDAYILLVSVPWWATMTVFRVGSYPTYPTQRPRIRPRCKRDLCICLQNCVPFPSPPDATGLKVGLALQFAPHVQVRVVEGLQYVVLA